MSCNEVQTFLILKMWSPKNQTWWIAHTGIVLNPSKFKKTQKNQMWNSSHQETGVRMPSVDAESVLFRSPTFRSKLSDLLSWPVQNSRFTDSILWRFLRPLGVMARVHWPRANSSAATKSRVSFPSWSLAVPRSNDSKQSVQRETWVPKKAIRYLRRGRTTNRTGSSLLRTTTSQMTICRSRGSLSWKDGKRRTCTNWPPSPHPRVFLTCINFFHQSQVSIEQAWLLASWTGLTTGILNRPDYWHLEQAWLLASGEETSSTNGPASRGQNRCRIFGFVQVIGSTVTRMYS